MLLTGSPQAAFAQIPVVTSGSGASTAAIQPTVDAFRTSLGALNPNVAGSFGTGRREINWDGVPDVSSSPNAFPANFFNSTSPRGAVFSTSGTGFEVSANATNPTSTAVRFGNIDPTYTTSFTTFSAQRLFTSIGSNVLDVNFFVPGELTPALTRGFGAIFTDVDLANTTSMEFFGGANNSLGKWFAPVGPAGVGASLSFLGVAFAESIVSRVRITSGNVALAPGATDQNGDLRDAVAMDDFIFGEPVAVVPEPATVLLLAGGLAMLIAVRRVRRRA